MKFGVGQAVRRLEDQALITGGGRYTDDFKLAHAAHAYILRSSVAHGRIRSINTEAARKMKGVLGIYTGADVAQYGTLQSALPFKSKDGTDLKKPPRPALPTDKVRFVGDPIACVVAETVLQAKDAAEAIELDIEPLPVMTTPQQATAPGPHRSREYHSSFLQYFRQGGTHPHHKTPTPGAAQALHRRLSYHSPPRPSRSRSESSSLASFHKAIDRPRVIQVVIENVERGSHRYERINKCQRDPNHEGEILLPQRLAGFLPVLSPAE